MNRTANIQNLMVNRTSAAALGRLLSMIAVLSSVSTAWATDLISPVTQERSIEGTARAYDQFYYESMEVSDAALDFAPYEHNETATAEVYGAASDGGAWQNSTIGPDAMIAIGGAHGNTEAWDYDGWGNSTALSIFNVTFEITTHVRARIAGTISAYDSSYTETILVGPHQAIFAELAFGPSDEVMFDQTLRLAPGQYRFSTFADGNTHGDMDAPDYASASYDVALRLCPAGDIDEDGIVGLADLATLLAGYGVGQTPDEGDLNVDGTVDVADLAILLSQYGMSCSID